MAELIIKNWDKKEKLEKEIFIELMKIEALMTDGDTVVDGDMSKKGLGTKLCRIACASAAAAAISACAGNPICIAAAIAAGEACRSEC